MWYRFIVISVSKMTSVTRVMVVPLRTSVTCAMLCPLRTSMTYAIVVPCTDISSIESCGSHGCVCMTSVTCADSVNLAFSYLLFFFRFCLFFFCYSTFKWQQVFHICPSLHKAWSYVSCIVVCHSLSQMTWSYCCCYQQASFRLFAIWFNN